MAKVQSKYETVFILNPDLTEEATAAAVEKFKTLQSRTLDMFIPDIIQLTVHRFWIRRSLYLGSEFP